MSPEVEIGPTWPRSPRNTKQMRGRRSFTPAIASSIFPLTIDASSTRISRYCENFSLFGSTANRSSEVRSPTPESE